MSFRTFSPTRAEPVPRVHDGWRAWGLGIAIGAAAQLFFVGGYITWFLGALCHETGQPPRESLHAEALGNQLGEGRLL